MAKHAVAANGAGTADTKKGVVDAVSRYFHIEGN
jgi:hypothetical protein